MFGIVSLFKKCSQYHEFLSLFLKNVSSIGSFDCITVKTHIKEHLTGHFAQTVGAVGGGVMWSNYGRLKKPIN